jgi:hypothetical protein
MIGCAVRRGDCTGRRSDVVARREFVYCCDRTHAPDADIMPYRNAFQQIVADLRALRCSAFLLAACAGVATAQLRPADSPPLQSDGSTTVLWQRVFASPDDDWINDIVALRDGSYMAVGYLGRQESRSDWRALAVQLRDDGQVVAAREYGAGGGIDAFWSMHEADDGKRAFSGFTSRIGTGGIDGWTLVTETDGSIVKENAYGSGAGYDRFIDLAPAADGGYVFVGHAQATGTDAPRKMLIVKTDASGIEQWRRTHAGPQADPALYVEPGGDGGFIIAGGLEDDVLVLKIDAQGNETWRTAFGTPGTVDNDHGLVVLPDRRIVVVGYTASWQARSNDMFAATLSPEGKLLTLETFGGADDDRAILARADAQGRVWIIGYTRSAGAGGWDILVTRLDAKGAFEGGATTLGSDQDDHGAAIRPLADGSLLIGGYSRTFGHGGEDAFIARIAAPKWQHVHAQFARHRVEPPAALATPR